MKARVTVEINFGDSEDTRADVFRVGSAVDELCEQIDCGTFTIRSFYNWTLTVASGDVSETVTSDDWNEICQ